MQDSNSTMNSTLEIKNYLKNNFCALCLSSGRRFVCYNNFLNSFVTKFLSFLLDPQEDKICWECHAKLQSIQNFCNKAESARSAISEAIAAVSKGENHVINSLTSLSTQNLVGESILPDEGSQPLTLQSTIERLLTMHIENEATNITNLNTAITKNDSGLVVASKCGNDLQFIIKGKPSLIIKKIQDNVKKHVADTGNDMRNFAYPISKSASNVPILIKDTSIRIINNVIIGPFKVNLSKLCIPIKFIKKYKGDSGVIIKPIRNNRMQELDYKSFIPEIKMHENDFENSPHQGKLNKKKRKINDIQSDIDNVKSKVNSSKPATDEAIEKKRRKIPKRYGFETMRIYEELTSKYISEEELFNIREMDRSNPSYLNANYKCEKCVFGFKEDGCYMEHLNKHEIWYGPVVCSVCELRFKDMESLENHRKSHLIGFFCTQCSFASRFLQSVSAHYKREHRPPADHCCHKCDAVFSSEVELLSHLELGHGKPTCIQCGDTFRNLHQLKLHVQKVHDKLMFPCPVCGKQFNCDTSVKQHVKLVHDKKLQEPVQDPRFYCKQCDKFFQQYTYKIHLKTSKAHVGDNFKFECSQCTQKFATQPRLRMHVERVHLHVTNAACDICGQKCYNMIALRKHVKSRHTPKQDADRTHICNVCGKGFFNPTILSHHLLTHTGEKPYRCPHCHHRAAQKSTILTHCKYKHKELPAIKYSELHKVT